MYSRNITEVVRLPSKISYSLAARHSRLFSQQIREEEFVKKLTLENPKVVVIPRELQTDLVTSIAATVGYQRIGRLGGALLYPSLAAIAQTPLILAYTPVCVGIHHIAILRACGAIRDLVLRRSIFKSDKANLMLEEWMKKNKITNLSFNDKQELMLFSNDFSKSRAAGILKDTLGYSFWLDQISLEMKIASTKTLSFISLGNLSNNAINHFHLNDNIRSQINFLIEARSRRFRTPILLGAAGYILSSSSFLNNDFLSSEQWSMNSLFAGLLVGIFTNHNSVKLDSEKLWGLIQSHRSLGELISPEFRDQYSHLIKKNENQKINVSVNTFGDIVINPKFRLRSYTSAFFSSTQPTKESTNALAVVKPAPLKLK